jgi:release factor glutamine methyltransferase
VSYKIQSISDFRIILRKELSNLYYEKEIDSVSNIIIKTLLGNDRLHLLSAGNFSLNPGSASRLEEICGELKTGKPVQYVLGETEFYGLRLKVNENVLIPRQETEELVDLIIRENRGYRGKITDLATGSGCIAIALAKNMPGATLFATDISEKAVEVAKENCLLNGVNVSFTVADIMEPPPPGIYRSGIIVSNPPYVRESEKKLMHRNVLEFEPHSALFVPDSDPLRFYRRIFELSTLMLEEGGRIYCEINEALGDELAELALGHDLKEPVLIRDLNNKIRIFKAVFNG